MISDTILYIDERLSEGLIAAFINEDDSEWMIEYDPEDQAYYLNEIEQTYKGMVPAYKQYRIRFDNFYQFERDLKQLGIVPIKPLPYQLDSEREKIVLDHGLLRGILSGHYDL